MSSGCYKNRTQKKTKEITNNNQPEPGIHPCFYSEAKNRYGIIHLPVASECNIQCAYCRIDYDCLHENRPGVTKGVISPEQALERLKRKIERMPNISVAGVAGPGDVFAAPELTLNTFELIRSKNPRIALCVSTNGLNIGDYIMRLAELDVRYVTITINTLNPVTGALLYKWVNIGDARLYGAEGAKILIEKQLHLYLRCITAVGAGLVFDIRGRLTTITVMLIIFIAVMGYGISMGLDIDCGCFGPGDTEVKAYHGLRTKLYRDIILLAGTAAN